jgi:hypothetical protein
MVFFDKGNQWKTRVMVAWLLSVAFQREGFQGVWCGWGRTCGRAGLRYVDGRDTLELYQFDTGCLGVYTS